MLDRESTFADAEIVKMLKSQFIPVAIDQAYQRRQKDTQGEFYRKIAGQGPRNNFAGTTQGFYIATAGGKLLLYNNNRDPEKVRRLMKEKLGAFTPEKIDRIEAKTIDERWNAKPPVGGLVVRVRAKVLGGYEPTVDRWKTIFNNALSRDNLWISKSEHVALVEGKVPRDLQLRIARYHLVDNTRGEPPMWNENEVKSIALQLKDGVLTGAVHLETRDGKRGYQAEILGKLETKNNKIVRFDTVCKGEFWGEGQFTKNAPKGKFPLGISFELADGSDVADAIPPQASRGWVQGYIK